jgi:uncharacterized membrane protein
MKKEIILDLAKILGCGFAMFIALFAFDMWGQWLGFLMHLIPSILIALTCFYAWKHHKNGGVLFLVLGMVSVFYFNTYKVLSIFALISLPLFVIGALFITYHYINNKNG